MTQKIAMAKNTGNKLSFRKGQGRLSNPQRKRKDPMIIPHDSATKLPKVKAKSKGLDLVSKIEKYFGGPLPEKAKEAILYPRFAKSNRLGNHPLSGTGRLGCGWPGGPLASFRGPTDPKEYLIFLRQMVTIRDTYEEAPAGADHIAKVVISRLKRMKRIWTTLQVSELTDNFPRADVRQIVYAHFANLAIKRDDEARRIFAQADDKRRLNRSSKK